MHTLRQPANYDPTKRLLLGLYVKYVAVISQATLRPWGHAMSFLVVMTNTVSLNVAKKQKYHANAAITGTPCLRGRSRENVSEKRGKNDSWLSSCLVHWWPHPACQMTRVIDAGERRYPLDWTSNSRVLYTRPGEVSRCRWKPTPTTKYRVPRQVAVACGLELMVPLEPPHWQNLFAVSQHNDPELVSEILRPDASGWPRPNTGWENLREPRLLDSNDWGKATL